MQPKPIERKLELPLCVPCREELKREGRSIELVAHRTDQKVCCGICGNRRFGSVYYVGRAVSP